MEAVLGNDAVQTAGVGVYFTVTEESDGAINSTIFPTLDLVEGMQVERRSDE